MSNDFKILSRRHSLNIGFEYEKMHGKSTLTFKFYMLNWRAPTFFKKFSFENGYTNYNLSVEIEHKEEGEVSYSLNHKIKAEIPSLRQLRPVWTVQILLIVF